MFCMAIILCVMQNFQLVKSLLAMLPYMVCSFFQDHQPYQPIEMWSCLNSLYSLADSVTLCIQNSTKLLKIPPDCQSGKRMDLQACCNVLQPRGGFSPHSRPSGRTSTLWVYQDDICTRCWYTHYVIMLITHYGEFLQLDPTTISCCYTQPPYPDTPTTISYWHDVIPLGTYLAWVAITNFGASPSTSPLLNEATI